MWFGLSGGQEVEVPGELVSAHAEGRLVLFVGAGASIGPPSGLPTFRKLAETLCEEKTNSPSGGFTSGLRGSPDTHRLRQSLNRRFPPFRRETQSGSRWTTQTS